MRFSVLIALLLVSLGCAQTAVVQCWEPAQIDVRGMKRLMVAEFAGTHGEQISAELSSRLWDNDFYTIVDRTELSSPVQNVSFYERQSFDTLLAEARKAEVDGVIVGRVVEYRSQDREVRASEAPENAGDESSDRRRRGGGSFPADTGTVLIREGQVAIEFRLIDVQTGDVRVSKLIARQVSERVSTTDPDAPVEQTQLNTLAGLCLDEIVQMLAPHESSCEIQLAKADFWTRGSRLSNKGLQLVEKGDWVSAIRCWEQAIAENPRNHAALFNLSIAAARQQDYDTAERYALEALQLEHSECYTAGLSQIRSRRAALVRANDQRDARVASNDDLFWQ